MDLKARSLFLATPALLSLGLAAAFANPLGNQVVGGSAVVQGQGTSSVTVTQTTDRAIINWNTFNIGAGETTRFVQPGASSVVLNRVTGGFGPSTIDGSLYANGRVFLVNPNGLLIGRTGVIDTAGFLATTADIKNSDFMAGRYQFYTPGNAGASIVNLGNITAQNSGFAALVAPGVRNSGTITATLGTVGLTAGNGFTLDFYGDKLITIQVGDSIATQVRDVATGRPLDALVKNDGKISANGGRVELTAATVRTIVDSVINTSGTIEANTVASRNGTIILGAATRGTKMAGDPIQTVKVSGRISAQGRRRGQTGGTVQITGEDIQLTNAKVSVAGRAGGGTALIGGDIGGGRGNPYATVALQQSAVPTASTVSIDAASTIDASAWGSGNGGKVVVWADKATSFYGDIQARAGKRSGNGGFVEVSGKEQLAFHGTVDTSAANGKRGTLLLDPQDITIGGGGVFDIAVATLQAALAANDVAIVTGAGAGNGDITVASSFSWGGSSSLILGAFRNVTVNNGVTITNTGTGDLNIAAGVDTSAPVWKPTGTGTINLLGTIDFSNSLGKVNFAYNPASGTYAQPNAFNNVLVNQAFQPPPGSPFTTQFSPYMWVNNVTDLQNIRDNLAGFYVLSTIDASGSGSLNGGAGFAPIGSTGNQFTGRLVGLDDKSFGGAGGHIDNLTINYSGPPGVNGNPVLIGLFGSIGPSGLVSDVALNASITSSALFTSVGGFAGNNQGTIFNSSFSGSIDVTGAPSVVGGIAGSNFGLIDSTSSSASVTNVGTTTLDEAAIGGLVGVNTGTIQLSFATGPTTIAGVANNGIAGGLVGDNNGTVRFSYATGPVTVPSGATIVDAGGLVGLNQGNLLETFATGLISGPPGGVNVKLGGLVGRAAGNAITSTSYFDINTTGTNASAGGSGVTTATLKSSLDTLEFSTNVWGITPAINGGYPSQLWQAAAPPTFAPTFLKPAGTPTDPAVFGQTQQIANLASPTPNGQSSNSALPDTSNQGGGQGALSNGAPGTGGAGTPPQRSVIGPNGERFSSVPPPGETRFVNNEVMLQVNSNITPEQIAALMSELGLSVISSQSLDGSGQIVYQLQLPAGVTVRDAILALEAKSIVAIAQPNYLFALTQAAPAAPTPAGTAAPATTAPASIGSMTRAADPAQYSARKLQLLDAHRLSSGNNVIVAVIDSGIDLDHPGLKGNVSGHIDVVGHGEPPHSHGTGMAGAIVEHGRLIGIAPNAKILAVRAFSEANNTAEGTSFAIVKSIDWAVSQGARVINMSFAGPRDPALEKALKAAHDKGVVLVAAAGNAGPKSPPLYPGADPNVIAVTALDANDRVFSGANQGPHIVIAAPGVDVVAAAPQAVYQLSTGTSIATAHISGVVALLLERDPSLTPAAVQQLLASTAKDLGPKGRDPQYGWGLVDPVKALIVLSMRPAASR